ncbi:MAG: HDOD domain-containing protein [Burkholderiaceae bacterium]
MGAEHNQQNTEEIPVPPALRRLRQATRGRRDLHTTGHAGRQLSNAASDPGARISDLADIAFADPAVIIRLIRMANSSTYDTRDRSDVVSVQRAIALLGFEQTRGYCRALPTFESDMPPERHELVRTELAAAAFCARFARNLLDTRNPLVSDEGAVIVLIAKLLAILGVVHVPHEVAAIRYVAHHKPKLAPGIHRELFHEPVANLSREIVEAWSLPRSSLQVIIHSEQRPTPVMSGRDWLPLAVGLSLRVGAAIRLSAPSERSAALRELVTRYRHCIELDQAKLAEMIEESAWETIGIERSVGVPSDQCVAPALLQPHLRSETYEEAGWDKFERIDATGVISRLRTDRMRRGALAEDDQVEIITRLANGKPTDSERRLKSLAVDVDNLSRDYATAERDGLLLALNSDPAQRISSRVTPLLLEGLRGSLGFERVVWFGRRGQADRFIPELAVGIDVDRIAAFCSQPLPQDNLFMMAMKNRVDLHIADCTAEKINSRLPPWFAQVYPTTHSFLLMPLFHEEQTIGFILGDRGCTDPEGLTKTELDFVRQMRANLTSLYEEFCTAPYEAVQADTNVDADADIADVS